MPKFETRFTSRVSTDDRTRDPLEGKTLQQFRDECDVNLIVKRYGDPRLFEEAMKAQNAIANITNPPKYGDFSELPDLQQAMQAVKEAEAMFMSLPSDVRSRFDNDPVKLAEFVQHEKNIPEAIKLGILQKRTEKASVGEVEPLPATPVADNSQKASQEA